MRSLGLGGSGEMCLRRRPRSRLFAVLVVLFFGLLIPVGGLSAAPTRPEEGEVERLYRAALGRPPEPAGFVYWVKRRQTDLSLDAVGRFFLSSAEFEQRFGAPDDDAFVRLVYAQVLARAPDEAGRLFWIDQLARGLARQRLVLLFSESVEFMDLTGPRLPDLPPFTSTVRTVTAADLGASWRSGCPIGPSRLRLLEVRHVTVDDGSGIGRIVVHESVASRVVTVFERLYAHRFPTERMQTVDGFGGDDDASMAANNTSGFNCRLVTGGTGWSRHAYGMAIDINPGQNPYVRGSTILPPDGSSHLDRERYDPMMIRSGDIVVRSFGEAGWRWGGAWVNPIDYQHFDR
ncbi:MAG: DUF4214 domain-containing protein [Actinomycetota bacterium]|nr:DUF4214 domain-containing protein [Actinomycetota bacterium]